MRCWKAAANAALVVVVACAPVFAGAVVVGSPLIDRGFPNDNFAGVTCIYRGVTHPASSGGVVSQWSFYDDEMPAGRAVTPLIFEITAPGQYTVAAIGTTRLSAGVGVHTFSFSPLAGTATLDPTKSYTVGFTNRAYTVEDGDVVPGISVVGSVDFTGYDTFSDRWSYAIEIAALGTVYGEGGAQLDGFGLDGRIYSANFTIGSTAPPCPGDANDDGRVNFTDLELLLENWNTSVAPNTSGDVTGDGLVNFSDLEELLEAWGSIC